MSAESEMLIANVRTKFPVAKLDLRRYEDDSYDLDIRLGDIWCAVRFLKGRFGVGKVTPNDYLFSAYDQEHLDAQAAFKHIEEVLETRL